MPQGNPVLGHGEAIKEIEAKGVHDKILKNSSLRMNVENTFEGNKTNDGIRVNSPEDR